MLKIHVRFLRKYVSFLFSSRVLVGEITHIFSGNNLFLFTDAILNNKPINVFNNGDLSRDFTYIDDIIEGVVNTLLKDSKNSSLYKLYNIGNGKPIQLLDFIESLEKTLGISAIKKMLPMQAGDVHQTFANTSNLERDYNYKPQITVDKGIKEFVLWYKGFYNG